jgi:hypothetical protein
MKKIHPGFDLSLTSHCTLKFQHSTLQLPSNIEKKAEAKKGITKLLLFHICGKLSNDSTSFGDLSYPKPAQGMRIVLDSARLACATGFSDLIKNTCA